MDYLIFILCIWSISGVAILFWDESCNWLSEKSLLDWMALGFLYVVMGAVMGPLVLCLVYVMHNCGDFPLTSRPGNPFKRK